MRLSAAAVLGILSAFMVACGGSESSMNPDSGVATDGGNDSDGGSTDGSTFDGGRVDGGPRDVGFSDPDTVLQGMHVIEGVDTYVHLMGTLTSTLPPVIFLPTGPDLSSEYLPSLMRFLLPRRLLMFYDLRATGRTSFGATAMTTTLTVERHRDDLDNLINWLGTRAQNLTRVDLVGHGYGAGVATLYAAAHPERVGRLVVTGPYPATALQLAELNVNEHARLTSTESMLINNLEMQPSCRGDESGCTIQIWNIRGPHFLCEENSALFSQMTFIFGSPRTREYVEFGLRDQSYDWRPIFRTITVPTTVISGPCDPIPPEAALAYTSSISGAIHHVLDQSGHFPMLEQRDQYQRLVLEALRR